jgi:dTDP-4-dehydrorhamnose 3,5-epimerase
MHNPPIQGVKQIPLKQIHDERGKVMHMLRSSDPHFEKFGEVYFSWIFPNIIKAWHKHNVMKMNYAVPIGCIKLVLFDDRKDSSSFGKINEFFLNPENYYLLTIPSGIWYGFKAVGNNPAMIVNCSTISHDPSEIVRISYNDPKIPYTWETKNG